jgi:hypothetical protein
LLDTVTSTFASVWVAEETVSEATRTAEEQGLGADIIAKIEEIRNFVREGLRSGGVIVGAQRNDGPAAPRPVLSMYRCSICSPTSRALTRSCLMTAR